jgi:hypothetical protein
MSRALYVVILSQGRWWVDLEGQAHGPFTSLEDAAKEGTQMARFAAHTGRPSEVLVPDDYGRYRVAWTSEKEPYAASDAA